MGKNMDKDLISIIMPVYNCEKYLKESIISVKKQTYENWELIIVNDGSIDNSYKVIEENTENIKNKIVFINLKENKGVANARNIALKNARGKYIAYLDSDDTWEKQKLEKQMEFMKKENVYFSYTKYSRIKEDGTFIKIVKIPTEIDYKGLLKSTIMLTSTIMIDVEKIGKEKLEMPDLKRSEDTQTWLNILKSDITAYGINERLTNYRQRKNSISSNKAKSIIGIWKVYREYQDLGIIESIYYTLMHSINALKKRLV